MNTKDFSTLPHEWFFGAYLVLTWLRLVFQVGFFHHASFVYLNLIVINSLAIVYCMFNPTVKRWRIRLLFYAIALNIVFPYMRFSVPLIHPLQVDTILQSWDKFLIGGNLSLMLQPFIHPWLTEFFSLCYAFFMPYLYINLVIHLFGNLNLSKKFYTGLFSIYGLGFIGYTCMPAFGPYLALKNQFTVPLLGYWMTSLEDKLYPLGTNYCDVFPSLHCAISLFILLFDFQHNRRRFYYCLIPVVGLWISTIYLRYHYFVDVCAGLSLGLLATLIANITANYLNKRENSHALHSTLS